MSHERFHHDPCVVHAAAGSVRQTVASKTKMDLIQAILSILLAVVAGLAVIQLVIGSWKTRGRYRYMYILHICCGPDDVPCDSEECLA